MKATDIRQGWTQDGAFVDANGARGRCYDVLELLEATASEPNGDGAAVTLPAGARGVVLFFSTGEPCWLQIEYETPGRVFGVVEATKIRLR